MCDWSPAGHSLRWDVETEEEAHQPWDHHLLQEPTAHQWCKFEGRAISIRSSSVCLIAGSHAVSVWPRGKALPWPLCRHCHRQCWPLPPVHTPHTPKPSATHQLSILFCRKVNQRLKDQVDRFWHTTNIYMNSPLHEYAQKLTAKLPENLSVRSLPLASLSLWFLSCSGQCWLVVLCVCVCVQVVYFTNSGGEANELAIMMSRLHTGAFDIVTLRWSGEAGEVQ